LPSELNAAYFFGQLEAAQEIYNAVRSNNISKDLVRTSLWTFSDNAKMIKYFAEEEESYEIPPLYPKGWTNLY